MALSTGGQRSGHVQSRIPMPCLGRACTVGEMPQTTGRVLSKLNQTKPPPPNPPPSFTHHTPPHHFPLPASPPYHPYAHPTSPTSPPSNSTRGATASMSSGARGRQGQCNVVRMFSHFFPASLGPVS